MLIFLADHLGPILGDESESEDNKISIIDNFIDKGCIDQSTDFAKLSLEDRQQMALRTQVHITEGNCACLELIYFIKIDHYNFEYLYDRNFLGKIKDFR